MTRRDEVDSQSSSPLLAMADPVVGLVHEIRATCITPLFGTSSYREQDVQRGQRSSIVGRVGNRDKGRECARNQRSGALQCRGEGGHVGSSAIGCRTSGARL